MMARFFVALLCAASLAPLWPAHAATIAGGRYGEVQLTEPVGAMRALVLLFSRGSGWSEADQQAADTLAENGTLVVGIDTGHYLALQS